MFAINLTQFWCAVFVLVSLKIFYYLFFSSSRAILLKVKKVNSIFGWFFQNITNPPQ